MKNMLVYVNFFLLLVWDAKNCYFKSDQSKGWAPKSNISANWSKFQTTLKMSPVSVFIGIVISLELV